MARPPEDEQELTPRDERSRPSSTGKVVGVKADQTSWRVKLQTARIKFDDDQKAVYLDELAAHGLKGRAAKASGVTRQTVANHMKNDLEFMEQQEEAMQEYRDMISAEIRRRGHDGYLEAIYQKGSRVLEPVLDEDGHVMMKHNKDGVPMPMYTPASVRKFSDPLITLEARRVEPAYREKQTVDLNHKGGVLVAPADMPPADWVAQEEAKNEERDRLHEERTAEDHKVKPVSV